MTEHIDEETLAAFNLDLLSGSARDDVRSQISASEQVRRVAEEYRAIVRGLRLWQRAPQDVLDAATHALDQRIRLHRLLAELISSPSMRRQAAQNPEALFRSHGIATTPELIAAFKELDVAGLERAPGQLDERVTKLFRFLHY